MFTFDSIVDTVSGAQTKLVETFVFDKKVQAEMVKLVEAQAKFAKTTYNNGLEIAEKSVKHFNDSYKALAQAKKEA